MAVHHYTKRIPSFLLLRLSMSRWLSSKLIRPHLLRLAGIKLGKNAHVGANVTFDTIEPTLFEIGDNVTITMNCVLLMHFLKPLKNGRLTWHRGKMIIGNNVFVGTRKAIPEEMFDDKSVWEQCIFDSTTLQADFSTEIHDDERKLAKLIKRGVEDNSFRDLVLAHTLSWEKQNDKIVQFAEYDRLKK